MQVEKMFARVCAQNYSSLRFFAKTRPNLRTQSGSRYQKGNGETSSTDHAGVRPRDRDFDLAINTALHVQDWFVHFFCHESTQILEYE